MSVEPSPRWQSRGKGWGLELPQERKSGQSSSRPGAFGPLGVDTNMRPLHFCIDTLEKSLQFSIQQRASVEAEAAGGGTNRFGRAADLCRLPARLISYEEEIPCKKRTLLNKSNQVCRCQAL